MKNPVSSLKNMNGHLKGYGGCDRCGDRWNWKKTHTLWMTNATGCFPLCEECWLNSTKEEKLKYYLGHLHRHPDQTIDVEEADKLLREQIEAFHNPKQEGAS